jgi:hypothetical protein
MREAIVTKEWGEVGFGSSKTEGWSWEVAFFVDGNEDPVDRHYYKTETVAKNAASLFERGLYCTGQYGGVEFEEC